jgi:CRP-like cAMP-binding protein
MMLVGAGIYAYIVGSITSVVTAMEASSARYQEIMDMLNAFLEKESITTELRITARQYIRTRQSNGNLLNWDDLLGNLSDDIREDFAKETHLDWALRSKYLCRAPEGFQAKAAASFKEEAFPSGERILEIGQEVPAMYVVKKGAVGAYGRVLGKGGIIGLENILDTRTNPEHRSMHMATALTFTVMESLSIQKLESLLDEYPETKAYAIKTLNWEITRMNCWAYASAVLEVRGKPALKGAPDRDLVDFYKWKVKWLNMTGLQAVRLFKAVIHIQRTARGHICRRKFNKSKEDGIAAIHTVAKKLITAAIEQLEARIEEVGKDKVMERARAKAQAEQEEAQMLQQISAQITSLSSRVAALESP